MKNKKINKIIDFVDEAINDDDIEYKHQVKGDILEIKTNSFFNNKEIIYNFKIQNDTIYFYSSNNEYEIATEQLFFDEMLGQCQDQITK